MFLGKGKSNRERCCIQIRCAPAKKFKKIKKSACIFRTDMLIYSSRKNPGVAKFGIALEWGSRGRWFDSSHSDHLQNGKSTENARFSVLFSVFCNLYFLVKSELFSLENRRHFPQILCVASRLRRVLGLKKWRGH